MTTATKTRQRKSSKRAGTSSKAKRDIYAEVTDTLIAALKAGTVPWRKPWAVTGLPLRMNSRTPYRGINSFVLWMVAAQRGYSSPWWGTYDEIARLSGMKQSEMPNGHKYWTSPDGAERGVRKGEKGTLVVFWKRTLRTETDTETGEETSHSGMLLQYTTAFNADQAAQLPDRYYPDLATPADLPTVDAAEEVMAGYLARNPGLTYTEAGDPNRAFYRPGADLVNMPPASSFTSASARYSTIWHELGHSTGHPSRLDRPGIMGFDHFGSEKYGKEELVAEMTAAMVGAVTGTATDHETGQSAAYLASWIASLKGDAKLAVLAAAGAQKAADLIRGITYDSKNDS